MHVHLSQLGFQILFHCGCTDGFFPSRGSKSCSIVGALMASLPAGVPNLISLWTYLWLHSQPGFQILFHCGCTEAGVPILVPLWMYLWLLSKLGFQILFHCGCTDGFFPSWGPKSCSIVSAQMASFPAGVQILASL